jgi:hypothetical protein
MLLNYMIYYLDLQSPSASQDDSSCYEAEEISGKMPCVELSVSRSFMDEYMSALFLHLTNIEAFQPAQATPDWSLAKPQSREEKRASFHLLERSPSLLFFYSVVSVKKEDVPFPFYYQGSSASREHDRKEHP